MDALSVVIVTGLPRSGTSMMMRMLEAGGIPCYYEQFANEFNPYGYYEARAPMSLGDLSAVPDGHAVKCLFMAHAIPADTDVRVIVMRRDFATLLASESRRAEARNGTQPGSGELFLQAQLDATRLWVAGKPHVEVWYEDMLRNPANECLRIARMLGREPGFCPLELELDLAAMALIPDPELCHA